MGKRIKTRGSLTSGDLLTWTLAVPTDVTLEYGITALTVVFDALATTKTTTINATFIDTPPATTWDTDGFAFKLCDHVIFTGTAPVGTALAEPVVSQTEADYVDFYAEFLTDQVIEFGLATDL